MSYTVVLTAEPDGSGVNVTVPAMSGVFTWGRDEREALESAREAIELHLEGYVERGLPFPIDVRPRTRTKGAILRSVHVAPPERADLRVSA